MNISAFDLFSIGIGPSSSHTVGPMRAANDFVTALIDKQCLSQVHKVIVELYGSLALTGKGHGTDNAIVNALEGKSAQTVDPDSIVPRAQQITDTKQLLLGGHHAIHFEHNEHLLFHYNELLPLHTNGLRFSAYDSHQQLLHSQVYYSIGGGFIVTEEQFGKETSDKPLPYPFSTAAELLTYCQKQHLTIRDVMFANEKTWRTEKEIRHGLLEIARVMKECVEKGCRTEGHLPGGLNVKRRAPDLCKKLIMKSQNQEPDKMLWPMVYAMAVNEENASGGRIVTAPTNGAAGIIPAVLHYYRNFVKNADDEGIITFLLTAAAIAILYKKGASISGAEVGCQGEVGVACSMAAGALTAVLGGTLDQIENAAEIAMEHHLGLTCDPIGGLVQIPCIERNGLAARKAINIAELALLEDGKHIVSLDKVIETMRRTGKDMNPIYKETSRGGLALAVNIPEC